MTDTKLLEAHADLLADLALAIEQASEPQVYDVSAPAVSKWSVKDHLEHLSIANDGIVRWIERAGAGDTDLETGGSPTLLGRAVLLVGAFPRGRGVAPERTVPKGTGAQELVERFRRTRERVEGLAGSLEPIRTSVARRNHFVFGDLSAAQWLRFSVIHNHHHQKIIRDVLSAGSRP